MKKSLAAVAVIALALLTACGTTEGSDYQDTDIGYFEEASPGYNEDPDSYYDDPDYYVDEDPMAEVPACNFYCN